MLERPAALTPRPRINLLVYHGILAPNAAWRAGVVPAAGDEDSGAADADSALARDGVEVLICHTGGARHPGVTRHGWR